MTPRPTRDVSHAHHEQQRAGTVFGPGTGYGGDVIALSSGRVDAGRLELHERVEAEMAASGLDYPEALDCVVEQARHGVVRLSQGARAGLGLPGEQGPGEPGRGRGPVGPVRTLSAARGELPERPEDSRLFADTLAACQAKRPGATVDDRRRETVALVARAGGRMVT
jgi:hypothetical protein